MSIVRSGFQVISGPDLRRLLAIAVKHQGALFGGTVAFALATPLVVMTSLWLKTGLLPNRLEALVPALRSPASGLSLVTVRAVGVLGGWEYELTVREALRLVAPAVMFGLYLAVLVAVWRSGRTRRLFRERGAKGRSGVAGGLLALVGTAFTTGISLTPPCIGVVTTVSLLGLAGFGVGVALLPYLYLLGSLTMLLSLILLVRRVKPCDAS